MVENTEKNNYAEVFPNPLNIYKGSDSKYCETSITIKNLINNYLIFKIYVNIIDKYLIKPSSSFIKPNESKKIIINRNKKNYEENNSIKEKFLIKIYIAEKIVNSDKDAKEMLKQNYDEKKESFNLIVNINLNDSNSKTI